MRDCKKQKQNIAIHSTFILHLSIFRACFSLGIAALAPTVTSAEPGTVIIILLTVTPAFD